jgi:Flp pilus assembly CpaF family ATPase
MKEQSPIELPAPLTEIPMLAEYEAELAAPIAEPAADNAAPGHPFGIYSSHELRSSRTQWPTSDLDWAQVVELRRRASEMITDKIQEHVGRHGRPLGTDDRLLLGRAIIRRVVADHVRSLHRSGAELWSPTQEEAYVTAVENAVFGYGRLQPLLDMPDVENIEIHGWDSVVVQYGDGHRERMPPVAESDAELVEAIRFLGQNSEPSRPFDDTHPTMTLALGERFRLHALAFGLSHRPSIVIRQHTLTDVSLADLAQGGLMPYEVAQFLDAAILARKSMVISGDQGAGKTTLLRAFKSIPLNERFGTLETDYELMTHLQPGRENILALQARVGHGETSGGSRVGDFTISDLVPEALRQNLSRLVVGEVRGGEAAAMFEAMQAGRRGRGTMHHADAFSIVSPVLNATRSQRGERGRLDLRRGIWKWTARCRCRPSQQSRRCTTDGVSSTSSSLINSSRARP